MSHSKLITVIDIGSTKIVTLVGQYFAEEEKINIIGTSTNPANGFKKGQIINIEEATSSLVESIEATERMAGCSISQAFVGITTPQISSINSQGVVAVSNPNQEITEEDVERVIEAARAVSLPSSQQIIHVLPQQFTVDGQEGVVDPVGMSGVRLEVKSHIVTTSTSSLKNLTKAIEDAGVNILEFVFTGFAAAESILTPTEKELGVVLVDIGGTTSSVTIFREGGPCYSAVIPVGGKHITNDLAIGLRLSLEKAEKIKLKLKKYYEEQDSDISLKKMGISAEDKKVSLKTAVDGIVLPRLQEIFSLIGEEIKESGQGGSTPAGIILTGGGAETIKIKYSCQHVLGLPVRIAEPKKVGGVADHLLSPEYSSSIGLIFYAIKQNRIQKAYPYRILNLKKLAQKIPIQGAIQKVGKMLKQFLP